MKITLDFSNLPGEVAMFLSEQQHTRDLSDARSRILSLGPEEHQTIRDEILGCVAKTVEDYLDHRPAQHEAGPCRSSSSTDRTESGTPRQTAAV